MKERPIIMSGDNPKLILEGRKTQTRRIVEYEIDPESVMHFNYGKSEGTRCPYGVAGDRLYVRETHWRYGRWVKNGISEKTGRQRFEIERYYAHKVLFASPGKIGRTIQGWHQRPSIFLPKKLARTWLEITKVRVERLNEISEEDVHTEGLNAEPTLDLIGTYAKLWEKLHGKNTWQQNPWVWVLEFRRV